MATLEKIRSKSVLLIVVIGVALLAFIIGDAITNSRNLFGDTTTVAKIGGKKIDYTDYVKKREELNAQLEDARRQNPAQYANFDTQILSQMALDDLIRETLLDQAADNAGIRTSPSQLSFYVLDNPVNPAIRTILQQLNAAGHGVSTPQQAFEIIFNPKRNGIPESEMVPFQRAWLAMEQETAQMVRRQTYQKLLVGTVKANNLDKKALYNDYVSTRNVNVAFVPYGKIDADKYKVEESEVKAEYENIKGQYKVDELTKDVAFISVMVNPSAIDRNNSRKLAEKTAGALRQGQVDKDLRKEGIMVTRKQVRAKDLSNGPVKDFISTAPSDSVKIVTENFKGFTIVKMGKRLAEVDSIQLNIVQVAGAGQLPERVMARLNSGLAIDSINTVFSADSVMIQKEQWLALFNKDGRTGALEASQLDSLTKAGGKYISLLSTPQASVLAQVVKQNAPVEVYEYEEVTYELKPSSLTLNDERSKLENFLAANPSAKDFAENAQKAGYSVRNISLNASVPAMPRNAAMQSFYPDSRQVVRWVMMDGKPGEVSHIYESKDAVSPALYAVAVLNEYEDYTPLSNPDVKSYVTEKVRKSKAGDQMVAQYKPKAGTMESAAQAMGVESKNNAAFRFGRNAEVRDAAVMGQIAGSKPGKVVVVKGDNGVYAYQIVSTGTENFPYNEKQYEQQYFQFVNPNLEEMLKGAKNFKNNIYKFEAGD